MMYMWTKEQIEQILMQLDALSFPFRKYAFSVTNQKLCLLGTGGYALVYQAETRVGYSEEFAIKVIGFNERHVDSADFQTSVQAQKELSSFYDYVVKVYDYTELWVWIDEDNNVVKATKVKEDEEHLLRENCLKLQFVVMEKVVPVLTVNRLGNPQLTPAALAFGDEKEIVKLAYEIGGALSRAHEQKLLHRDVKLENIFYTPKRKCYKLGDFGISKVTDNGLASTFAFTKGYGAPEVVIATDDKYDNTADIYSLGMLLYVLLNGLRFPESDNYNVNIKAQYRSGYIFSKPKDTSEDLFQIIEKMCRFNPDDRYQSMNEMMIDLDKIAINKVVGVKRNHDAATLIIGAAFFVLGLLGVKQMYYPDIPVNFSVWTYMFFAILLVKMVMKLMKMDIVFPSAVVLCIGTYLMVNSGFEWWKLAVLFLVAFTQGIMMGIVAVAMLLMNILWILSQYNLVLPTISFDYHWVPILLLSLANILLWEHSVINSDVLEVKQLYYSKNFYWVTVYMLYIVCILQSVVLSDHSGFAYILYKKIFGSNLMKVVCNFDWLHMGLFGLGFSIVWNVRERILLNHRSEY